MATGENGDWRECLLMKMVTGENSDWKKVTGENDWTNFFMMEDYGLEVLAKTLFITF